MNFQNVQTIIQSLELFPRNFSLASALMEKIQKLKEELQFLKTYLMYVEISEGKHCPLHQMATAPRLRPYSYVHVPKPKPGSTSSSIEVGFIDASSELLSAINVVYLPGGRTSSVDTPVTRMSQVIKDFEPQIREAYTAFLKNQSWQPHSRPKSGFWGYFTDSVLVNFKDLLNSKNLIGSTRKLVESLQEKLKFLRDFVGGRPVVFKKMGALLGYAQAAACLSYLGWVDGMDRVMESGIEIELSHLLQEITPSTPELMETYFELLKASKPTQLDNTKTEKVASFVNFLVDDSEGSKKDQFAAIHDGPAFLITFVVNLSDYCTEDEKQISGDIQELAREAVSLNIQFPVNKVAESQVKKMNFLLSKMLGKMKLIKAEILLMEKMKHIKFGMLGMEPIEEGIIPVEDVFTALHEGLKFLRTSFVGLEEETKDCKTFFSQFEKLVDEVTSLISSIHAGRETEKIILILSLEKIKLMTSEIHLMELQNHETNRMNAMKNQNQMLRQGLAFLRTLLMDSTDIEEKTEEGKLFLISLQAVTSESSSLISSFFVSEALTEERVNEISHQVSILVEKIEFLKSEVVLDKLLNHEMAAKFQMKAQIKTFKESLIFLRSFLMDPPRQHKENGKMILEKSESVVNEAASLICSVYDDLMEEGKAVETDLMRSALLGRITDI